MYMAPEQLKKGPLKFEMDMFALGIVLFEMANRIHPFEDMTSLFTVQPLKAVNNYEPWLNELIRSLLVQEPERRPTCE